MTFRLFILTAFTSDRPDRGTSEIFYAGPRKDEMLEAAREAYARTVPGDPSKRYFEKMVYADLQEPQMLRYSFSSVTNNVHEQERPAPLRMTKADFRSLLDRVVLLREQMEALAPRVDALRREAGAFTGRIDKLCKEDGDAMEIGRETASLRAALDITNSRLKATEERLTKESPRLAAELLHAAETLNRASLAIAIDCENALHDARSAKLLEVAAPWDPCRRSGDFWVRLATGRRSAFAAPARWRFAARPWPVNEGQFKNDHIPDAVDHAWECLEMMNEDGSMNTGNLPEWEGLSGQSFDEIYDLPTDELPDSEPVNDGEAFDEIDDLPAEGQTRALLPVSGRRNIAAPKDSGASV